MAQYSFSFDVQGQVIALNPALKQTKATFTDANGDIVTVSMSGKTGVILLARGVAQADAQADVYGIELQGTDAKTGLSFSVKKDKAAPASDGATTFGRLDGSTPLAKLTGKTVSVVGDGVQLTGAGYIASVTLNDLADGAGVVMPTAAPKGVAFSLHDVGAGVCNIAGDVTKLTVNSIAAGWNANVGGLLKSLAVKTNVGEAGSAEVVALTARQAGSISIKGNLGHAEFRFTQAVADKVYALSKLAVTGRIENTEIRAVGHVKDVSAGALDSVLLLAGMADGVHGPTGVAADFTSHSTISKVTVKGIKGQPIATSDAAICAWNLGSVTLVNVQYHNDGTPFGLATDHLKSLSIKGPEGSYKWTDKQTQPPPATDDFEVIFVT